MNTETFEPATEPVAQPPLEERPVHLARCIECGHSVPFRPNSTGTGFVLVGTEATYGAGENGRPICPDGHGEMEIADDRLPIEQAMEQAAERIDATTQRLPFPSPPFNYEGALHEIFEKQQSVAILEGKFNDADERRKKAKAALDEGHSQLSVLIATLQEREQDRLHEIARREAAAAAGHPEDTTLVRCAWELAHLDERCPLCSSPVEAAHYNLADTARDSALHLDAVERLIHLQDTDAIVALVDHLGIVLSPDTVSAWSVEDRAAVKAWAEAPTEQSPRPAILGTAHVAGGSITSEAEPGDTFQCCRECGARLLSYPTGSGEPVEFYPAGTLVGSDCDGAKEPARYAKRGKKKAKP
jgi:hypothetical protein